MVIHTGWSSLQASHQGLPALEEHHLSACRSLFTSTNLSVIVVFKGLFQYVAMGKEVS